MPWRRNFKSISYHNFLHTFFLTFNFFLTLNRKQGRRFLQNLRGTSSMFSFTFWGLVSTIGGREAELAHNLIYRHSAIVLRFGTDVRCLRQTLSHISNLSLREREGMKLSTLMPAPLPSANALIRTLHAYNTSVRSEGAAMLAPSCMYIVRFTLRL